MNVNQQRKLQAMYYSNQAVMFITQPTSVPTSYASPDTACITYTQGIVTDIRSNSDGDNLEASVIRQVGSPESQCFDYGVVKLKDTSVDQVAIYFLNEDWDDIQLNKNGDYIV